MAEVSIDFSAWEDHAGWWEQEAERARERMNVDDDTIAQARQAFGKIGSSTIGADYVVVHSPLLHFVTPPDDTSI